MTCCSPDADNFDTHYISTVLRLHNADLSLCGTKTKKVRILILTFCAQNRNRTCTSLLIPDFESDASTNSAIWASKAGAILQLYRGFTKYRNRYFFV